MSSSYLSQNPNIFQPNFTSRQTHFAPHDRPETSIRTAHSSFAPDSDCYYYDDSTTNLISQSLAVLQHASGDCMSDDFGTAHPDIRIETSTPIPLPPFLPDRQDSVLVGSAPNAPEWMYQPSMGGPGASSTRRPLKRVRTHDRTPSASTIASNGPASPFTANTSYPQIANTDYSPNSPAHYAEPTLFSKNLPTPQQTPTDAAYMNSGYIPSNLAHTTSAHLAMKGFAIDHHLADEFPPDFIQSSRQSMSSGHDSPATPQSGVGEHYDSRNPSMTQNDFRQVNPNVQLFRTESQAYQDELYNPPNYVSTPMMATKRHPDYLSPHRNLVNERLQTANLARSASPTSALSRERSPFRDGSPLAPEGWSSTGHVGTAAGMRQQQKEESEQVEYAQHRPQLQREQTKTISPKDAVLEYTEEQPSLFQDNIPAGYRQHTGGTENWQSNFVSQPNATFGSLVAPVTTHQDMTPFSATSADGFSGANFSYMSLPPTQQDQISQIQGSPFPNHPYTGPKMNYVDANPEFPANLTSMESSISESGPPMSSQDSFNTSTMTQRPADTRANTGTYTCTYHGCTQRFDSHVNLQKHKRDFHRSQAAKESTSTGTDSTSPRSTESPAPSGTGMTSAEILARNSQAGPHKCTRINPSTNKPCNTIFSRPYDLTRHEDTIHNNRKQKVRCPMCREEKTFSRNDALTRHMRVVHPEVEAFGKRSRRE